MRVEQIRKRDRTRAKLDWEEEIPGIISDGYCELDLESQRLRIVIRILLSRRVFHSLINPALVPIEARRDLHLHM